MLIFYGSLYPWQFVPVHLTAIPLSILLHSWRPAPERYWADMFLAHKLDVFEHSRVLWIQFLAILMGLVLAMLSRPATQTFAGYLTAQES